MLVVRKNIERRSLLFGFNLRCSADWTDGKETQLLEALQINAVRCSKDNSLAALQLESNRKRQLVARLFQFFYERHCWIEALLFKPRPPAVAIVEAEHFVFVSTGFFVSGNLIILINFYFSFVLMFSLFFWIIATLRCWSFYGAGLVFKLMLGTIGWLFEWASFTWRYFDLGVMTNTYTNK